MKILVTGGAGFIGSHLVERLVEEGHAVTVLDILKNGNKVPKETLRNINLIIGDVRNEKEVLDAAKGCRVIFHLAAMLGVDVIAKCPVETMDTEFFGLKNSVKAALLNSAEKIIYSSTSGVYGREAIMHALVEDFPASPNSSYSIAKRFSELYLKSIFQETGLNSFALRFFNVYGPRQDDRMVIPRFMEQAQNNEPMTVYKPGTQTRDFTFVADVVESMIRVMNMMSGHDIMNVAYQKEYTIKHVAEEIKKRMNSKSEVRLVEPADGRYDFETGRRFGSSKKMEKLTGFAPETTFESGLIQTIKYFQEERSLTALNH